VDTKYLTYSVEDFAQDQDFIAWIKRGKNQKKWEDFIRGNPGITKNVIAAKKILLSLRFDIKDLPEEEVYDSYKPIENLYDEHHNKKRKLRVNNLLKYAALLVLVFSIGAVIPIIYFMNRIEEFTEIPALPSGFNDAKLILSSGKEILLTEKQTDIEFNSSGNQIKIDKDSVINYPAESSSNAMAQVIVPYGNHTNLLLSDGTKVWLNAGSKLIFPQKFSGKNRKVFLKGEAYFDVAKDEDNAFIVRTDRIDVTVHGTEFNLKDNDSENELEVVLVEGAVSIRENSMMNLLNKETKLIPNQKAIYNKSENKIIVESNINVSGYTSWREGLLMFEKESILNVFKRLSRYYNVRFATESGVELNKKISGKLDLKGSLDDVMKVVSDVAPITYKIENDKVIVTSKINYLPMR
jgi:hypothetical protein